MPEQSITKWPQEHFRFILMCQYWLLKEQKIESTSLLMWLFFLNWHKLETFLS